MSGVRALRLHALHWRYAVEVLDLDRALITKLPLVVRSMGVHVQQGYAAPRQLGHDCSRKIAESLNRDSNLSLFSHAIKKRTLNRI